ERSGLAHHEYGGCQTTQGKKDPSLQEMVRFFPFQAGRPRKTCQEVPKRLGPGCRLMRNSHEWEARLRIPPRAQPDWAARAIAGSPLPITSSPVPVILEPNG